MEPPTLFAKDLDVDSALYGYDDLDDPHFPLDVSESLDTRQWARFASPTAYLEDLFHSNHRMRHGFPTSTPDPLGRSPTLPLYFPDHGSPSPSASQAGQRKYALVGTDCLKSAAASPIVRYRWSPIWNSRLAWLSLYFSLNLLLTLSNKSVLTDFPFPYTLTAIHALFSTLGGAWLRWRGIYTSKHLGSRDELVLVGFSVLYAINIAVSNISLNLVTIPFHQVVRAVTPIFTLALSRVFYNTHFPRRKIASLAPVIFGVALATYGDYYCTAWGLFLTLLGTFLAALKTIYTNVLQSPSKHGHLSPPTEFPEEPFLMRRTPLARPQYFTEDFAPLAYLRKLLPPRLDLHPLDLLTRMSPLAFVQCVAYAYLSGELDRLRRFSAGPLIIFSPPYNGTLIDAPLEHEHYVRHMDITKVLVLLVNGCIAFGLNVVSFSANGKVGALSMTVAANVKQVLTILCAVSLFNLTISPTNATGITITLLGGAWYAYEEYSAKARGARNAAPS